VYVVRSAEIRHEYNILIGKPEGKRPFGRTTRRWKGNIKRLFREIGCEGVQCFHLAQDRGNLWAVVNSVINRRISKKAGNLLTE
jgi:hypothetical protein